MQCSGPAATTGKRRSEKTNKKFSPYHSGLPTSSRRPRLAAGGCQTIGSCSVGRSRSRSRSSLCRRRLEAARKAVGRTDGYATLRGRKGQREGPPPPPRKVGTIPPILPPEALQLLSFRLGTGWMNIIVYENWDEIIR